MNSFERNLLAWLRTQRRQAAFKRDVARREKDDAWASEETGRENAFHQAARYVSRAAKRKGKRHAG